MNEILEVGGLRFEVRRSTRRRTLGLTVDRGGELVLHAPEVAGSDALLCWTRSKLVWVHRKLAIKDELAAKVPEPEFVVGESFSYLGRSYRLMITRDQAEPLRFDGCHFILRRDARPKASEHFRKWYLKTGSGWVKRRVRLLVRKTGKSPSRVEVKDLGFRWGSCAKTGVVFFNWRLLQLPVRFADYVICHELTHLTEPHHGPSFWAALARAMPDWEQRERELGTKARDLSWCEPRARYKASSSANSGMKVVAPSAAAGPVAVRRRALRGK